MPCEPAPPCEPNFPLFCEPLPTTTNAQRIVVEDLGSCQKTLQKTQNPSLLHQTVFGNIQFSDASANEPIKMPFMAEHQTDNAPKIIVLLADGTMKAWEPTNSLDNFLAYWDGTSWKIGNLGSLFPGNGVFVKNTLGQVNLVSGLAGESLQYVGTSIQFAPQSLSPVPTGLILPYAAPVTVSIPSGYLECDGSVVNQGTYINLFSVIGATYNLGGEGPTDFRLPDLRGYFIRGFGTNVDTTASGPLGAKQTDEFEAHDHKMFADVFGAENSKVSATQFSTVTSLNDGREDYLIGGTSTTATLGKTSSEGSTETRPANIAMRYLIKT